FASCLAAAAAFAAVAEAQAQAPASLPAAPEPVPDPAPDPGNDRWRTTLLEENDSLYFNSDKHYTQGLRLSFLSPELVTGDWMGSVLDFFALVPTVFAEAPPGVN